MNANKAHMYNNLVTLRLSVQSGQTSNSRDILCRLRLSSSLTNFWLKWTGWQSDSIFTVQLCISKFDLNPAIGSGEECWCFFSSVKKYKEIWRPIYKSENCNTNENVKNYKISKHLSPQHLYSYSIFCRWPRWLSWKLVWLVIRRLWVWPLLGQQNSFVKIWSWNIF